MDEFLYKNVFGNFSTISLEHHNYPSQNLLSINTVKDIGKNPDNPNVNDIHFGDIPFYGDFGYESEKSFIIHAGSGIVDRANELLEKKAYVNEKITFKGPKLKRILNYLMKMKKGVEQKVDPDAHAYLKWFNEDPLPGFQGEYNWLYTGGNVCVFNLNDSYYLITQDDNHGTLLNIIKFDSDLMNGQSYVKDVTEDSPVFQILYDNSKNLIATRQIKSITLHKINDEVELNNAGCFNNERLIVCCDINSQSDILAMLDVDSNFRMFDVITEKELSLFHCSRQGHWGQMVFHDESTLFIADESSILSYDWRAGISNVVYSPSAITNDCESICNVFKSGRCDNIYYVATSHNLIEVDIRNWNSAQRWTHMMEYIPQYGQSLYRDDEEIIILQSQISSEVVGILNKRRGETDQFISLTCPQILKSIRNEVKLAQLNGKCLAPLVNERLDYTITGLNVMSSSKGFDIFTANAAGDVFVNRLTRKDHGEKSQERHSQLDDVSQNLDDFGNHCTNVHNSKPLFATDVVDLKHLAKEFTEGESATRKRRRKRRVNLNSYWRSCEVYSIKSLNSFKDLMSDKILDVWDIEMNHYDQVVTNVKVDDEEEVMLKVNKWLENVG